MFDWGAIGITTGGRSSGEFKTLCVVYGLAAKSSPDEIRYIGITSRPLDKRVKQHKWRSEMDRFRTHRANWIRALLANGDDVVAVVIESELSLEQAKEREVFWIAEYRKRGARLVNSTDGGDGMFGYKFTEEQKRNVGNASRGRRFKHSDSTKSLLRQMFTGRVMSPETKRKMSESAKKRQRPIPRRVRQLTLDGELVAIWPSMVEAAKAVGLKGFSKVAACCVGSRKTSRGYCWEYMEEA